MDKLNGRQAMALAIWWTSFIADRLYGTGYIYALYARQMVWQTGYMAQVTGHTTDKLYDRQVIWHRPKLVWQISCKGDRLYGTSHESHDS